MEMPFSEYALTGVITCMNQLQGISDAMVVYVRGELARYEAARTQDSTQNLADTEGKTLVKADVLEWEVTKGGVSGPAQEYRDAQKNIMNAFSFCPYTPKASGHANTTLLVRS
ncbi:MAG: hypothetical protein ACO3EK_14020 [Alphaproteobacteria bacterium]